MDLDDDTVDELPAPPREDIPEDDRQLLELVARAVGARFEEVDGEGYGNLHFPDGTIISAWNPLLFSGDAFDLMVALELHIDFAGGVVAAYTGKTQCCEDLGSGANGASRRALVRAAAEIGKSVR